MNDPRRAIPAIEKLLAAPELQPVLAREPRTRVTEALRAVQERVRQAGDAAYDAAWYAAEVERSLSALHSRGLQRVINATGVVLHTNLGRAPLADAALRAITEAARGYSNLEYDLDTGTRGSRYHHCIDLLRELTGAPAALVVNNNAGALVLALNTLAAGKQVIISRGELVEIGGSFRIPDVLERSGARLLEVGATNRTHLRDYEEAITGDAGALLKVHRSNFEMSGFVSEVEAAQLAVLCAARDLPFIHDLGSGLLEDLSDLGLDSEPTARSAVQAAADGIVTMSGDKLLGGPQAGILLGSQDRIARMRNNPLSRALRVDKLTIAALAATLEIYARGSARADIPVLRMLQLSRPQLDARARRLQQQLQQAGIAAALAAAESAVGGGAFPGKTLPTTVLLLEQHGTELEPRLRGGRVPIIARMIDDRVAIDLRTVPEDEEPFLLELLIDAARA
jgi:L-seryl-tRNA(Ser) seleniumtransferase